MKKICCLVLSIFVITSVLVGCQCYGTVPNINTQNTEMLKEKYITPIVESGVYGNWENANDINPYALFKFYQYSDGNLYDYYSIGENGGYYYNQEKVENFIMKCFDINTENLRKSDDFEEHKKSYKLYGISGGVIPTKITGAKQLEDILTIDYEILDVKDETYYICETKIKVIDKDNYKYISCVRRNTDMEKTNEVRGISHD